MNVTELIAFTPELGDVVVPEVSPKFVRNQPAGLREFVVSGPKADAIRLLIFADRGYSRKRIAALTGASVSRVGEVVWGLQHDAVAYPAIATK
jgi:hypothetical protein